MLVAGIVCKIFEKEIEVSRVDRNHRMLEFLLLDASSNSEMKFDIFDSKIETFSKNVFKDDEVIVDFHIKSKINPKTGRYYNNLIVDNIFLLKDKNNLFVKEIFKNSSEIYKLF